MWDRKEKPFVLILFAMPAIWLVYSLLSGRYFPDPAEPFMTLSGIWASVFLGLVLALSSLTKIKRLKVLTRYRRFLGLTAFWYVLLHLLAYLLLHAGFSWLWITEDLIKRPYIYVGLLSFLILSLLALTSFKSMIRVLGKRWKPLHRMVYLASVLVIAHLWWQVKSDTEIAFWLTLVMAIPLIIKVNPFFIKLIAKRACTKSVDP